MHENGSKRRTWHCVSEVAVHGQLTICTQSVRATTSSEDLGKLRTQSQIGKRKWMRLIHHVVRAVAAAAAHGVRQRRAGRRQVRACTHKGEG